ncbi:putative SMODS and SLOG-associating 2TM effector domain-containing protein [Seiridium cardinale]|uniref:SMODS and SLOG-associating 2TM effector domain-containing protein n=1 Tax=Seiridium cardinale TaxID=138064 RepID=A0ABR2X8S2_9PEZI
MQISTALRDLDVTAPISDEIAAPSSRGSTAHVNHVNERTTQHHISPLRWWYVDILAAATATPSEVLTINDLVAIIATVCRGAFMASVASVLSQEKWNRFLESADRIEGFALLDGAPAGYGEVCSYSGKFRAVIPSLYQLIIRTYMPTGKDAAGVVTIKSTASEIRTWKSLWDRIPRKSAGGNCDM